MPKGKRREAGDSRAGKAKGPLTSGPFVTLMSPQRGVQKLQAATPCFSWAFLMRRFSSRALVPSFSEEVDSR